MARNKSPMFRIDAGTTTTAAELGNKFADPNKRKRKERIEIQPSTLNVDVHGILFAIVAVVFVIYPLAQYFLGL